MTIPPRVRILAANFYDLSVRASQFSKRVGAAYLGLAGPTSVLASKRLLVGWTPYFVRRGPWAWGGRLAAGSNFASGLRAADGYTTSKRGRGTQKETPATGRVLWRGSRPHCHWWVTQEPPKG